MFPSIRGKKVWIMGKQSEDHNNQEENRKQHEPSEQWKEHVNAKFSVTSKWDELRTDIAHKGKNQSQLS